MNWRRTHGHRNISIWNCCIGTEKKCHWNVGIRMQICKSLPLLRPSNPFCQTVTQKVWRYHWKANQNTIKQNNKMNYFLMSVLLFSGTLSDGKFSMPNFIFIAKIHWFLFFCRKSGKWVKNLGNNYASQVFHLEYLPQIFLDEEQRRWICVG